MRSPLSFRLLKLERETRVELATSTLARSRSTTELLPQSQIVIVAFIGRMSSLFNCLGPTVRNAGYPTLDIVLPCFKWCPTEYHLIGDCNIFNKTPIAAGVDLNVADPLVCDHHICRVPERIERQFAADYFPRLLVLLLRLFLIDLGRR